jgi:hypothetical protein
MGRYALTRPLYEVVREAYLGGFAVSSNFAREKSQEVAAAASIGFISTLEAPDVYGRTWHITGSGLQHLRDGGYL